MTNADGMKVCTVGKEETQALAQELLKEIGNRVSDFGQASVLGLRGDLGTGKTTLTQGIARELGVTEEYRGEPSVFLHLIHMSP